MCGGIHEVGITARLLALGKSQGDGDVAAGFKTLAPERSWGHFHMGEGDGSDGIASIRGILPLNSTEAEAEQHGGGEQLSFHSFRFWV